MFTAMRRCPAALSRAVATASLSPRVIQLSATQASIASRRSAPRVNNILVAAFHASARWRQAVATESATAEAAHEEPITKFADLAKRGLVHPNVIDVITKKMKLETMTDVQTRTINEALSGVDVIAQAKTGTGKTLGFLIPVVQRIIQKDPHLAQRPRGFKKGRSDDIRAIVISPTRELAEQIAVEARKVTFGTGIIVQTAVGGTQKRAMLQKTQREGCHLLIGTPGRLLDIFSDPYSGVKAPRLAALIMDEADRLLDDGFQKEIVEIKNYLPDPDEVDRQTLMFSATVPREVVDLVRRTLKPGFHFARCVNEDEAPTHERIPQKIVHVSGFENIMPSLYELVLREVKKAKAQGGRPFKAIIYFNSTAEVTLAASVFFKLSGGPRPDKPLHGLRAYEIHSKLSQAQRTKASDSFRFAESAVLFSSDVTARGMDFPNVTHVIQVGLPRDRESYIHRLGRTGRAGKEGEGWLIVTPIERQEVRRRLHKLPMQEDRSLETAALDLAEQLDVPHEIATLLKEVTDAHQKVYPDQLEAAFRGVFGSFQWTSDKQGLLEAANRWAEVGWGMPQAPKPPQSFLTLAGSGRRASRPSRGGASLFDDSRGGGSRAGGFGGRSGGDSWGGRGRSFGGRDGFGARSGGDRGGRPGGNGRPRFSRRSEEEELFS
ncbi:DEAD-domain-containing protein [Westerdykella ornata]|uniref:ATP-dependent RNA helicase n=1 Tax=Westerdykella ornata TaxID=318751 RepID=A0A6A6JQ76_WESOR|nr:DEAD-domain-containing protein [Westerdykella ornata]KAF2277119.1 DEAD-domain-containing protein [Westerdykella ornata]